MPTVRSAGIGACLLAAAFMAAVAVAAPAAAAPDDASVDQAIDRALGDHRQYQTVIAALQQAVADHDAGKVSALIDYPLRVTIGGKKSHVRSAPEFIAKYTQIVTPAIQRVITEQRYADLFVNSSGVMFGNGQVWLRGICKDAQCQQFDVKVVTIQSTANPNDQNAH